MPEAKLLYLSFQHFVDLDKRDQFDIFTLQHTFSLSRFNVTYKVLCRYPDIAELLLVSANLNTYKYASNQIGINNAIKRRNICMAFHAEREESNNNL